MRDGYLRGSLSRPATQRQMDVLAAFVTAGGSVQDAAELVGIRLSAVKRHLADLRARCSGHPRSGHHHPQQDGVHPEAEHKLGLEEQDQQDRRRDGRHRDDRLPPA